MVITYQSHSALNMIFDVTVLALSIPMWFRKQRTRKEHMAITGLAVLGAL